MSVDHKRPLFAFAIVAIACAVIIVNGIRSEAFVAIMRTGASHIVAGMVLEPVRHRPQHTTAAAPAPASVDRSSAPPAPVVSRHPVVSRSGGRQATVTTANPSSGHRVPGSREHASGRGRGHHDGPEPGRAQGRQHENQGRSHGRGHQQHARSHGQGQGHDQGRGYGRGYRGDERHTGHSASAGRAHEGHDRRD